MPNQEDLSFIETRNIEVQKINSEKIGSNTLSLRLELKNENNYQITNIVIDDMDSKIDKNIL